MPLSKDQITDAALNLLAEGGLENVSFRKLAAALEVQAPALYWHVENKRQLIDQVAETILQQEFANLVIKSNAQPWQDWLILTAHRLRRIMLKYPDGARVIAGAHFFPTITLGMLFELSLRSLMLDGVELMQARKVVNTVYHYAFGHCIEEQDSPSIDELQAMNISNLSQIFPTIAQIVSLPITTPNAQWQVFDDGLRLIIAGYKHTSRQT